MKNRITMMTTLLRSVPKAATLLFVFAVVMMNFLARYTLVSLPWLALNAGIFISWLSFLFMDIFAKNFGAGASNLLSIIAVCVNLFFTLVCVIIGRVFDYPSLDTVIGGQWSILVASTIAFVISALSNSYTNIFVGKRIKADPDSRSAFAARAFVSTLLSQILDNFIFVFLAFMVMPMIPGALPVRWSLGQCIGCSVVCAFIELLSEIIFSPIGYAISRRWKEKGIGKEYLEKYNPEGV